MTVAALAPPQPAVTITAGVVRIDHLLVEHPEAAALAAAALERGGAQALEDLVRRALPIGMLALTMGNAAVDTGGLQRTLDAFAEEVDRRSSTALNGLEHALQRLQQGEAVVATTAKGVLDRLPAQVQAVLGGEAANVRAAVTDATRAVQAAGLAELQNALTQHTSTVRNALSLDHAGPVQQLRQDLLGQLDNTRRELTEQLTAVRGLLQAAEAHKAGASTSTRAVGQAWERTAMDGLARETVERAGDLYESTGSTPAPGGTGRAGDAVATLNRAITGHGKQVRILLEAKTRTKPLSARAWREELASSRDLRECAGALAVVPTAAEVPGGGPLARVDTLSYVVAGDDPANVTLVYLVLRELVALVGVRQEDGDGVDVDKVEAQIRLALSALDELNEVGRLATAAKANLEKLFEVAGRTKKKIYSALTDSLVSLRT